MPKLGQVTTTRLMLPSTANEANDADRAWVDVKSKLTLGDMMALNDCKTDAERGLLLVTAIIKDWNFTEDGTDATPKLAVDADNVNILDLNDFVFLSEWISENVTKSLEGMTKDEKKTSSSTSIPVTETPQLTI